MLWTAADCSRLLGGGRVTFCKSGKDRTSMSVTLEATRLLCRNHGMDASSSSAVTNMMRLHGVRRSNVYKNTDAFSYAFNNLQVRSLPAPYRPPAGSHR